MTDNSDEPDTRPENGPLDTLGAQLRAAGIPVTGAAPVDWRDVARGAVQKRSLAPPTRPGFTPPSKPARPEPVFWGAAELCRPSPPISAAAKTFLSGKVSILPQLAPGGRVRLYATLEDLVFRVPEAQWSAHLAQMASLRRELAGPW